MISVFDITVADNNLGNEIIMESAFRYLREAFPEDFFIKLPYLDSIGPVAINYIRNSSHVIFPGGNSLTSDIKRYRQWGIDRRNAREINNVILMGIGWWQYQEEPTRYTRRLLQKVLDHESYHSARDSYTAEKLMQLGFDNVLVTGCPSIWSLTKEHCRNLPSDKSEDVLATLTDYNTSQHDRDVLNLLLKCYRRVMVWPQGSGDSEYARGLSSRIEVLQPTLKALDQVLASPLEIDYVGTRLHAGIRALQMKRRSIILAIDNRATEMARDFHLPVVAREQIEDLEEKIYSPLPMDIDIPVSNIDKWMGQFR